MKTLETLCRDAGIPRVTQFYLIGGGELTGVKDMVTGETIVPPLVPEAKARLIQACLNRTFSNAPFHGNLSEPRR